MFSKLFSCRRIVSRLAMFLPVFVLSACLQLPGGGPSIGQSVNPNGTVPVALLIPKSSPSGEVRGLAGDLEKAARLAISDISGASIDLRVYDTAGQAGQAAKVARQAVGDGAKIIIGPLYAEAANAAAVAVRPNNVNVLSFSNNTTIAGENLFVLGPTFANTAGVLAAYAAKQGKTRIVSVYSQNVAGEEGNAALNAAVARHGGVISGAVSYAFSEAGVVNAVPKVKAKVQETNADAIFLTANAAGALPLLAQMLPEAGVNPATTQYIGLARWDVPAQTLRLPGVQGGWFALPDPGRSTAYANRFQAAYGKRAHPISGLAYDGIAAIGALLKKGRKDALQTSGLTQSAGFQGATGIFRFLPDGTNERALAIASVSNKQAVIVQPAPSKFGLNLF